MKVRKIGKQEICMVLRVDKENGYIDLSKKRVPKQEMQVVQNRFADGKVVQAIMRSVMEETKIGVDVLYQTIVFPLQRTWPHALEAFNESLL